MSYQNKRLHILPTSEPEIDAIKVVGNQDWFQIIGCFVDETSKIDKELFTDNLVADMELC